VPHIPDKAQAVKIIDEFGELTRQIATWQPRIDRVAELRKIIEGWFANDVADESFTLDGKLYCVVLSARAKRRTIVGMTKLYKALGQKTFLEYCSFPLTILDELLRRLNLDSAGIVNEERSGPRTVKAVLREAAAGSRVA
jgi:hypothetical protein